MKTLFIHPIGTGSEGVVNDFKPEDLVLYLPDHEFGIDSDCFVTIDKFEPGIVSSCNVLAGYVHVRFWNRNLQNYEVTAKACRPNNLWHRGK